MEISPDPELETFIHRRLRELPDLPAPQTLAPRVLAALQARAQAWWRRAWWDWPLAAQSAFVALALGVAGLVGGGGLVLNQNVSHVSQQLAEKLPQVPPLRDTISGWVSQAWAYAGTVSQPVWLGLLVSLAMTYLFCIGVGSAFFRVAVNRH
jgi:hypothetical protein